MGTYSAAVWNSGRILHAPLGFTKVQQLARRAAAQAANGGSDDGGRVMIVRGGIVVSVMMMVMMLMMAYCDDVVSKLRFLQGCKRGKSLLAFSLGFLFVDVDDYIDEDENSVARSSREYPLVDTQPPGDDGDVTVSIQMLCCYMSPGECGWCCVVSCTCVCRPITPILYDISYPS